MARVYSVRGRTVATAATADHAAFSFWNPSANCRVILFEVGISTFAAPAAGAGLYWKRISARGTPGSTATPTIENDNERLLAPPSGLLLDLAVFTVQPTLVTMPGMKGWLFGAVAASGLIIPFPRGLVIPVGTGIAFLNMTGVIFPASDVYGEWEE